MLFIRSALIPSAAAFTSANQYSRITAINQRFGARGMADTRNPDAKVDEDPPKSILASPSFEGYLKQRAGGGAAPAATAPAAAGKIVNVDCAYLVLFMLNCAHLSCVVDEFHCSLN